MNLSKVQKYVAKHGKSKLARDADLSYATILRLLSDETYDPHLSVIRKLAAAVGAKASDLVKE